MEKLWFKRKNYGWGWYPSSWQGWLVTLVYLILVISFANTIDDNSPAQEVFFTFLLPITIMTIAFIRIAYRKGEKPKWQWGNKNNDKS